MKAIPVQEAVGTVLCQDITRIIPGKEKGRLFKRGRIITEKDIEVLLDIGKANIYVYDPGDGYIHEDEAALRLARAAAGSHIAFGSPAEGKVTLTAQDDGLLCIDVDRLLALNSIENIIFGTIHTHQFVKRGRHLAGTRVIPLAVPEKDLLKAEHICSAGPALIRIKPFKKAKIGVITTGSEIFSGRIKDAFGPVLKEKFTQLGSQVIEQIFVSDDVRMTVDAIRSLVESGVDMIAVTGGMSVDPDDQTPRAIKETGARIITYGAPIFPGAMFLLGELKGIPVVGLPGCVMYYKASIFDLIIPRILAGEKITEQDIQTLGHGGFCEGCESCRFPVCGFGKR
ncbi:MAG: molybdopterin-binding protein [Deltaproteobacteria bacterium]|nr:MAG: molybdopterin-binding protein [Deltaproteobacteria bacterium]